MIADNHQFPTIPVQFKTCDVLEPNKMRPTEIDPAQYQTQLSEKQRWLEQHFAIFSPPPLEVFESAAINYRMRAEFRVWHQGDDLFHIMFDQQTKEKYRVDQFPPASKLINQVMQELMGLLRDNPVLRTKLFQIDYLSTLSKQIVVTLVYHRQLDNLWQQEIDTLRNLLREKFDIEFIGRARKQKLLHHQDYVIERLPINGKEYIFKQLENSFTQPNAGVNCQMIQWALDVSKNLAGDLLELYCGSGNFSLPLAQNFNRVLATEISKPSVAAAQYNITENQLDNVQILRMSSEEFVEASSGKRDFHRLRGIELKDYQCNTVLVDPPRSGLDHKTVEMVSQYDNIIYISCNPETLANNLQSLNNSHKISRFALFDQFPYTHHAEAGIFLQRR